jgi:hypothetical protein
MLGGGPQPINVPDDQGKRPPIRGPEDEEGGWTQLRKKVLLWGGIALLIVLAIFFFMSAVGSGAYG